ncbi:MATE family efflux transporter [Wenxinia marina]|uniref:Putative efflux protein, MATE family n=1 Tax=Wenxinia marina DSM 24838 TaxID=1123501 RepID=A0A0D0NJP2_9RHOB|nr:MATE family efflux transporter [Wenxinia marina]KIQ68550.1 putative efflux protein, MATE family [Wenxinia marina DSM 24838]GGL66816.1 MATE family efflux transporter [Wenxinia marina]
MSAGTRDLTQGPVWRALATVSGPMLLGIAAVLSVGLADAFFLSRLGGAPLAAVGYIYPVTTAITSLSIGLSAAANATVSQALGRGDDGARVHRLSLHAVVTGGVLALAVAGLFYLASGPLFGLIGARDEAAGEIAKYVPWWALSFPFLVLMMQVNAVFRAHGRAGVASVTMLGAAALNIALDPLLIFGWGPVPGLGTGGAALATCIARVAAAVGVLLYAWREGVLAPCGQPLRDLRESLVSLARIGGPAAFSNAINPAGMAAVTAAVATLGESAVAGFGAATRVQSLAIVPLLALSSGIGPVVGQNWGAEKRERAGKGVGWAFTAATVYGLAAGAILFALAGPIAGLLTPSDEERRIAALYLRVVGWTLFGYGFVVIGNAAMNARDRALYSMGLSLARILAVYLPLAWGGVMLFGYPGILGAAAIANVLGAAGAVVLIRRTGLWTGLPDLPFLRSRPRPAAESR